MADREMTLVADEGMRILNPKEHNVPYFIEANDDLWEAWREIQARGSGDEERFWFKKGWRIRSRHLPNGSSVMTLDIRFDPTGGT